MLLSIVVPVYNEQEVLLKLLSTIRHVMADATCTYEIIIVDDGSMDRTSEILHREAKDDPRVKVLFFTRNFGHQAAITAGLDCASGDGVVVIDADLQDPPELLPEMIKLLESGYDVVSAQRITRDGETYYKRFTAKLFYWMIRKMVDQRIQPEIGDFRLFSRRAVLAIRQLREQHRFMRGMVAWLGLKEVILPYHRQARVAGSTKYSTVKMLRFAWTAISSFSALPLRLSVVLGLICTLVGLGYGLFSIFAAVVLKATVPGWTSLVCLNIVFSGATLVCIGLVGDYVAKIYEEAKGRPLYVVSDAENLEASQSPIVKGLMLLPPESNYERAGKTGV
jgi:polyisoprenyl-phosphate glycosyltransferase